jgi:hypothetical protein
MQHCSLCFKSDANILSDGVEDRITIPPWSAQQPDKHSICVLWQDLTVTDSGTRCSICGYETGRKVKCSSPQCDEWIHPWCATQWSCIRIQCVVECVFRDAYCSMCSVLDHFDFPASTPVEMLASILSDTQLEASERTIYTELKNRFKCNIRQKLDDDSFSSAKSLMEEIGLVTRSTLSAHDFHLLRHFSELEKRITAACGNYAHTVQYFQEKGISLRGVESINILPVCVYSKHEQCCVCSSPGGQGAELLSCVQCKQQVHASCVGVEDSRVWTCDVCAEACKHVQCILCSFAHSGTPLKRLNLSGEMHWVHIVCAKECPGMLLTPAGLELPALPPATEDCCAQCSNSGVLVKCSWEPCTRMMHIPCSMQLNASREFNMWGGCMRETFCEEHRLISVLPDSIVSRLRQDGFADEADVCQLESCTSLEEFFATVLRILKKVSEDFGKEYPVKVRLMVRSCAALVEV